MTYDPLNVRSELMNAKSPGLLLLMNESDGGVVETRRRFQAACAASIQPARSPTRGSGFAAEGEREGETVWAAAAAANDRASAAITNLDFTEGSVSGRR